YLDLAGRQAIMRGALKEAQLYLQEAIATLSTRPESPERLKREFDLQYTLWGILVFTSGYVTTETAEASRRVRELGERIGNPGELFSALLAAWTPVWGRGELTAAQQIADQMLEIAERTGDSADLTRAHLNQGFAHFARGELLEAERHLKASIAYYNESEFSASFSDPRVAALCFLAGNSWHLGMADTARAHIQDAISSLERLNKPSSPVLQLIVACGYYMTLREPENVQRAAELLVTLATEQQIPEYVAYASVYRGWAIAEQGRTNEGIALIRTGLDSLAMLGNRSGLPQLFSAFGEELARAGQLEEALAALEQAFFAVGEQQIYLPYVLWRRGEVHQRRGDEPRADRDFRETIAVARRMGSKAFELRATTSLARLLAKQGKRDEARAMLAEIYNWFTEGFDTAD